MADTFEKTPDGKLKRIKTVEKEEVFELSFLRENLALLERERDATLAGYKTRINELELLIEQAELHGVTEE